MSYYLKLSSSTALQTTLLGGRNENNIRLNKEQARASKAPYLADSVHGSQLSLMTSLMGVFCVPKPLPNRGLWMPKLVLYGIRLLAKQFIGTVLDIEVDQSGSPLPRKRTVPSISYASIIMTLRATLWCP